MSSSMTASVGAGAVTMTVLVRSSNVASTFTFSAASSPPPRRLLK